MNTIAEIKSIINDYNSLIEVINLRLKVVQSIEPEYYNLCNIYQVYVSENTITIDSDDYHHGAYDSRSVYFPIEWLILPEDDLIAAVKESRARRLKEEEERRIALEKERTAQKEAAIKRNEWEEYKRLKKKFEG